MTEDFLVIPPRKVSADSDTVTVLDFAIVHTSHLCNILRWFGGVSKNFGGSCYYLVLYILSGKLSKTLTR